MSIMPVRSENPLDLAHVESRRSVLQGIVPGLPMPKRGLSQESDFQRKGIDGASMEVDGSRSTKGFFEMFLGFLGSFSPSPLPDITETGAQ